MSRENKNYGIRRSLQRRSFLAGSAAAIGGAGAFIAAGCGDDDDTGSSGSSGSTGGSTTPGSIPQGPSPTAAGAATETPKRGGTFSPGMRFYTNDIPTLDPHSSTSTNTKYRAHGVYSHLILPKPGRGYTFEFEGDLAASWEGQDASTWTVKLRPDARFHPPLNRAVTSEDALFTFNNITGKGGGKAKPDVSHYGSIDSVSTPDAQTVVYKLKTPDPVFPVNTLANWYIAILPKETGTAFDPAKQMVGSGPFTFRSYETGTRISFDRFKDWHKGPDIPYFDSVVCNIVPDPTARLNFFLGGSLDSLDARGVDLGPIASGIKGAQVDAFADIVSWGFNFQYRNMPPDAPWRDARVRRAISMGIDRDAVFAAANEPALATRAGFKVDTFWNSHVPAAAERYYVDPRSSQMAADAAEAFKFNPQKAKALLAEAGYPNGFEIQLERNKGTFGDAYDNSAEILGPMLRDIGVRVNVVVRDHASWFAPKNQQGVFDQMQYFVLPGVTRDFPSDFARAYDPKGPLNYAGVDAPELVSQFTALIGKPDSEVVPAFKKLQDEMARSMYYIPVMARVNYWTYQPNIRGVFATNGQAGDQTDFSRNITRYWKA